MENNKIKVGLIGWGISAKVFHAPFIKASPHYEVTHVLERHKHESKEVFPEAEIVTNIEDLLRQNIDLVVITTPNDTHYPYTLAALEANKNVVVEKPFTIFSNDALQLINKAKQKELLLAVYHNRRYVSDYLTIKKILDKKLLGDVHTFEAHYDRYRAEERPDAWREKPTAGSGILYDLGAHLIDQSLTLFGLPKEITAKTKLQRPHAKAVDWFDLNLNYGFLEVTLQSGMLVREPGPRYLVHGTKGSFIKSGEDPQEAKLRAGEAPSEKSGEEGEEIWGLLHTEMDGRIIKEKVPSEKGNYGLFYEDLYQTLQNQKPFPIKPEQAYNVIKIIELAEKSSKTKCTVSCEGLIA
ncbi:MAG: Gfo/Idh/MocA family oxidoreductase [Bacteroidota bacterium]|nr:Gfo/Idh/MocA family oxidoreductase [Bacteroidota bacterium]